MKNFILIILILCSASLSLAQDKQDWKFLHPLPQSNNLRKIKMIDANTWFAVGQNGTFMRTTNGGANWYFHHFAGKINAALGTTYAYDLWFFNASTGIVVGDQGYISRTTNGGVSFDSVGLGLVQSNSRCWSVWFANANTGYIGAGSQSAFTSVILKTTNGGINWASVYTSASNYVINIGGTDTNNVTASWSNGTLVKTANGGVNWSEMPNAGMIPFANSISFLNSSTGFAAGGAGKFARTTNGGANWDTIPTPQTDWSYFQVKPVSASEIYLTGDPINLYKSTNLGLSWISIPISVPNVYPYIWYSIDKFGSTTVMSGDYGIVIKSTDNGTTWTTGSVQYNNQIMNDIQSLPGTSKIWFAGRPNAVGKQIMYSSNHGNNWQLQGTGGTEEFFAISMINENSGYASANNSKVFKTTNGGQNWSALTQPSVTNYSLYSMDFVNINTGWVCINYTTNAAGNVFKTTDGGQNWTQYNLAVTNPGSIMSCDFVNANTGFTSLNSSNKPVYKTTNGGVNWTAQTTGLTGIIYEVKAIDTNVVYAVTNAGTSRVAKSTNGGANWTLITLPVVADFRSIDFKDANTGYICGNSTTAVCRTTDGGTTWTFQNTHTITLGRVHVTQGDTAFVVGGITSILRYIPSPPTGITYNGNNTANEFYLKQNYPNPFNPATTIEFNLPKSGIVSFNVYDISGRIVARDITNLNLNSGNYKVSFDGAGLSSGMYFYSLILNGETVDTKKMILVK